MILRSYDSRFRFTPRSSKLYQSDKCNVVVGGNNIYTVTALPIADSIAAASKAMNGDPFWTKTNDVQLEILAVPFKQGSHVATKLTDFQPIILQLQQLHAAGFVHGDIRAYNVVLGPQGGLIDFDFGGEPGEPYPEGYRTTLIDGYRAGSGEKENYQNNTLAFWHDWYALGFLIFHVHSILVPVGASDETKLIHYRALHRWMGITEDVKAEDITKLLTDLTSLQNAGYTLIPNIPFQCEIDANNWPRRTKKGATGSPWIQKDEKL